MKSTDSKKLDQIITMLGDIVEVFGKRFDKIDKRFDKVDSEIAAVKGKVAGSNNRLDLESMRRTDLKLPRRMHEVEMKVFGASKHPKALPF